MTRFVLFITVLATAVIFQSGVLTANAHQMSFPFAFRFIPFKFPKRGDGQLDWSSWTMLKAGPYAFRPLASLNTGGDISSLSVPDDFYAPEADRSENPKAKLTSPRNLGLCHFKICPVGKRAPTANNLEQEKDSSSQISDPSSDYNYSPQK